MGKSWLSVKRHDYASAQTAAKGVIQLRRFRKLPNHLGRNVDVDALLASATAGLLAKGMVVSTRLWHSRSMAHRAPFGKQGVMQHG